ncbi:alpha/beta fold hydrolase [Undibacterium arcticum]
MNTFTTVGVGGTKVLLLPGLFGANEAFDAMLAFADTERFQYVVMDYRGYGRAKKTCLDYIP